MLVAYPFATLGVNNELWVIIFINNGSNLWWRWIKESIANLTISLVWVVLKDKKLCEHLKNNNNKLKNIIIKIIIIIIKQINK